jgi:predicted MFS family arabinose efflux permease
LPREVWLLFATNLINRAGMMVLPFLVLYLTRELGFSPARAGLMLAVYGASAIVFGPIGGRLSDRIGALPVMRASLIASGCVLLLFPLAKSFTAVAAMTALWAGCGEMFRPASLAAITHVVSPAQRKQAFALNRLAINLGMSVGPALGGFLATVSFRAMFTVDAVTTLLAGAVLALMPWRAFSGVNSEAGRSDSEHRGPTTILGDARFLIFLSGVLLVGIVFFQHESALPLYLVQYLHLSPAFYGMLFTINTLLIVALEVPLNTATAHWSSTRSLILGSMLFAIGFGALGVISSPAGVVVTVVIWTLARCCSFPPCPRTWPR